MFRLYLGRKKKRIILENSYINSSKLIRRVNEPMSLELVIDVKELLKNNSFDLFEYLISYNSELYLEVPDINKGYLFSKKHNRSDAYILIQKNGENQYLLPNGTENIPEGFTIANGGNAYQPTVSGISPVFATLNDNFVYNDRLEYIFMDNKSSTQNMVNFLRKEELSIAGQVLDSTKLKLTFYSGVYEIDFRKNNFLSFGSIYKEGINRFLERLLDPLFFRVEHKDNDYKINYTVEPKQATEILKEVLVNRTFRDGGFDLVDNVQVIEVYDSQKALNKHRTVTTYHNKENLYVDDVRQNYPSISADVYMGTKYIQEGDKCLLNFNNKHTEYRGSYMIYGIEQDLVLDRVMTKQTLSLLRTNRDVRTSYLQQNLQALNNRII